MKTADFDFHLPDDRIALRPAEPRDSARLLVVRDGGLEDRIIRDLPDFLRPGDALVFNDTRVIPARLSGVRERIGAEGETLTVAVEATLHHRDAPDVWSAFMKPGKRIKPGDRIRFGPDSDGACLLGRLDATVVDKGEDGLVTLRFDLSGPFLDEAIRDVGIMPLPPYIAAKRPEDDRDRSDYQTMFAHWDGSVAAPTAGLHFTPALMAAIEA
ncbi:S-adenosylmethionine:tRNA ribosyltransferase-isomerase, partial [Brevundimonas sp.]